MTIMMNTTTWPQLRQKKHTPLPLPLPLYHPSPPSLLSSRPPVRPRSASNGCSSNWTAPTLECWILFPSPSRNTSIDIFTKDGHFSLILYIFLSFFIYLYIYFSLSLSVYLYLSVVVVVVVVVDLLYVITGVRVDRGGGEGESVGGGGDGRKRGRRRGGGGP